MTTSMRMEANVSAIFYDSAYLYHEVKIINDGMQDVTLLTANNLDSLGGNGTESDPLFITYGLGTGRMIDTNGHKQVYSPYLFDPLTLCPGEYTDINTGEKDVLEWLNSKTGIVYIVFHYEITEDWGKRLNVWHGKISSPVMKIDLGPTTNRVSNKASQTIGSEASPQSGR